MKTFFRFYFDILPWLMSAGLVFWIAVMLDKSEYVRYEGGIVDRLKKNWEGGGHIVLLGMIVVVLILTAAIVKFLMWNNFLESNT